MTIRSTFNGIIKAPVASFGDSDPLDVSNVRDCTVNNAIHIAEASGQVRVNTLLPSSTTLNPGDSTTSTAQRITTFGPFPLSIRPDGSSFRLRCRVWGAAADNTNSVTFYASVSPWLGSLSSVFGSQTNTVTSVSTTSSTEAWRDFGGLIYLTAPQVAVALQSLETPSSVGGADYLQAKACLVCVNLYAYQSVAANAVIGGFYAAEFAG